MGILSELMRKVKRGEATQIELDFLDQREGIPSDSSSPSEYLSLLNQEARMVEPCTDCEEHQKKPRRKKKDAESKNL